MFCGVKKLLSIVNLLQVSPFCEKKAYVIDEKAYVIDEKAYVIDVKNVFYMELLKPFVNLLREIFSANFHEKGPTSPLSPPKSS